MERNFTPDTAGHAQASHQQDGHFTPEEKDGYGLDAGFDLSQDSSNEKLTAFLEEMEREEQQELIERVGKDNYAKIADAIRKGVIKRFVSTVNDGTGRSYKDFDGIIKSLNEGARHFQEAQELREAIEKQQSVVSTQQQAPQPQALPQQGDQNIQTPTVPQQATPQMPPQMPAQNTVSGQNPHGTTMEALIEVQADQLEQHHPEFVHVRDAVLRVARENNATPKDVFNGIGAFADHGFLHQAKYLATQKRPNNVMPSSHGGATKGYQAGRGLSQEQLLHNVEHMSAEQIERAVSVMKR